MPVINCLETAKKAYKDILDNEEIESVYNGLLSQAKGAKVTGADLVDKLNQFAEKNIQDQTRSLYEKQLQEVRKLQTFIDLFQRVDNFDKAGHGENAPFRGFASKITGSVFKAEKSKANTYNTQIQARTDIETKIANFLLDNNLYPLFKSSEADIEYAKAAFQLKSGEKVDSDAGKLAQFFMDMQDKNLANWRALGVDIPKRSDRIAPNIHNAQSILKLSLKERLEAKRLEISPFEYAYRKWNDIILNAIDKEAVFTERNVDINDPDAVDKFQREAFKNLTNNGLSTGKSLNLAERKKAERIYVWKDAESLVNYNKQYGSGSLMDAVVRELSFGASQQTLVRDWGMNPVGNLQRAWEIVHQNPKYEFRDKVNSQLKELEKRLSSLYDNDIDFPGTIAAISSSVRVWEAVTKLGTATLRSVPDIHNTMRVSTRFGANRYAAIPGVLKRFVLGMSKADRKVFARFVNTAISDKIGQVNRFYVNPFSPRSIGGRGLHLMHKLNLLDRWDSGNRGYALTIAGQYFAKNRDITWERLPERDKELLKLYDIGEDEWEVIRNSNVKIGSRQFITPDSVQELSHDRLREIVKENNPSDYRLQEIKDDVERKMASLFRDQMETAITNPDAFEKSWLVFRLSKEHTFLRPMIRMMTQFKGFGLAYLRRTVLQTLFEKGAVNYWDAINIMSGKHNWPGIMRMTTEVMALSYIGASLYNLAQGLSPPGLNKLATWERMMKDAIGILDIATEVNPSDLSRSVGRVAVGPAGSDIEKFGRYLYYQVKSLHNPDLKTQKALKRVKFQLIKSNIPFNTFATKWMWNHLYLNDWEDQVSPGKRRRDLNKIKENTGSKPLF